jgi:hypothetical protein
MDQMTPTHAIARTAVFYASAAELLTERIFYLTSTKFMACFAKGKSCGRG